LACLDGGCVSEEVVVLVVAFVEKHDGIWGGGDATVEAVGLSEFGSRRREVQSRRAVSLCREDDFKRASFPDHYEEGGFIVSFCMADG
jgi:hypothetical protein